MTVTLGFDVGTTRIKALIYDTARSRVLARVSQATPVRVDPDCDRRDADALWEVLARLCGGLAAEGAPMSEVEGVSLASLGEEIVFLDEHGLPTGPVTCWYVEPQEDWTTEDDPPLFRLASWYAIRSASRRGDPALKAAMSFTDLGSSLLGRMTGAVLPHMDRSHASRTGLLDPETGDWSQARLRSCGAARLRPPQLVDSGVEIGVLDADAAAHLGLPAGTPVRAGGHDHICAALAVGAERGGDVFVSVGTSESRLVLLDLEWSELAKLERSGDEVGYFADGRHRYMHTSSPSGMQVAELVKGDSEGRDIESIYAALTSLLRDDADDEPELLPGAADADPTAAALFAELERQAGESVAAIDRMLELTGERAHRIRVVGVPTRHDVWVRVRRKHSTRPLEVVRMDEPAAIGAALLAARGEDRVGRPNEEGMQE